MEKIDPPLRAVLFDMDGTLTRSTLDFHAIRREIGLPEPLLESMLSLPEGTEKERAFSLLRNHEAEAVRVSTLNEGAGEILSLLQQENIPAGLITRNSRESVEKTLARHGLTFDATRSREDGPVKPDPYAVFSICTELRVPPEETLMVGDYKYDIQAGERAGARTVLLTNGTPSLFQEEISPDYVIERLEDLLPILAQMTNR